MEKEKEEPPEKVYGVDTWTTYIDENITGNLTTTSLAQKFHYSPTHFKRIFRCYYKMSVSDYIRKRRMTMIAEKIREGMNPKEAAALYHFKTYAGFARAFQKEFHVLPTMYSKGMFEVIDLAKYYFQNKDKIRMSIIKLQSIKMIGHTIIPCKKEEVDIPAQMNYWRGRAFPCLENTRFSSNVERREDKIALWYHEPESKNIDYILGPVVQEFPDKIPEKMIKVTLEEGKYAIFETDKISDERDITETLRMYIRCIFYGWVKEYRDRVDLKRITFERYVDCKIYFYVPVNH